MELAIRIGNEYLDLAPGTTLQMEEENPFLQIGSQITGEYTMPFSVPATPKNMRLLGLPHLHTVKKQTSGIPAIVYANGVQHSRGQVKLETGQGNLNEPRRGIINLYYLYGLADFWKGIQNKYLSDCLPDSTFSFPFSYAYNDFGFFSHATEVMNSSPGSYPYAFLPVLNTAGLISQPDRVGTYTMNNVTIEGNEINRALAAKWSPELTSTTSLFGTRNDLCPFPYLHTVIRKIFANTGYTVLGDVLDDADFKTIVLLHNQPIDWVTPSKGPGVKPVTWDMKYMVPRVKVGSFLIGLANRFAWWYDFDYRNRVVTIKKRKNILAGRNRRDMTHRSGANYSFQLNKEGVVYSLVTPGGEDKVNIPEGALKGAVNNKTQLPVPTEALENDYYFAKGENAYFYCTRDETEAWVWEKAADNTFNYQVENSTEDISTDCLVPDTEYARFGKNTFVGGPNHWLKRMVTPIVNITGEETTTFYITYNMGIAQSVNFFGSNENWAYPMASGGCYDLNGNKKTTKSLVFEYIDNNQDLGVYKMEWEYFLALLLEQEKVTVPINFTLAEMLSMEYTDTVVIKGAEYFVKNPRWSLPLAPYTSAELVRLPVQVGI